MPLPFPLQTSCKPNITHFSFGLFLLLCDVTILSPPYNLQLSENNLFSLILFLPPAVLWVVLPGDRFPTVLVAL